MTDFDDEPTPLPLPDVPRHDPAFPTGRQPAITRGAAHPQRDANPTTRLWSLSNAADTTRMSLQELAAQIPLQAPGDDPMRTLRVDAALFRPVANPDRRQLIGPTVRLAIAFACGLAVGAMLL